VFEIFYANGFQFSTQPGSFRFDSSGYTSFQTSLHIHTLGLGSDYGYAWPDATQIKGSVCHSNSVGLTV